MLQARTRPMPIRVVAVAGAPVASSSRVESNCGPSPWPVAAPSGSRRWATPPPTPRGAVQAKLRISGIRDGVLFLPFHYGYWDTEPGHEPDGHGRAANELTITDWDPASKQPIFKTAAARLRRLEASGGAPAPAPTTTGSAPVTAGVPATRGGAAGEADEALQTTNQGGGK